ncbi:MAG: inositol monophosphatase family protein [Rhodoferax sp.]|nr:inositol monophosphatase family protein [Rhodoferax sp.]
MSPNSHPMVNVAIKAARTAGSIINRAALDIESVRVSQKKANDFVTEVDQMAEAAIIETLLNSYPGHGIWAEESGKAHGAKDSQFVWIIDPLDGTTNFIHGLPVYCVSIALAVRGKVEQAVVYDPTRNDLFTATKGRGAFLNNRRLRVSKRTQLKDSLIATGFPYREGDDFDQYLVMMGEVMRRTVGLRRFGSAALDLAYVAAGFTDGFFEKGLQAWDVAAGSLLVTEAGGLVGNLSGDADFLDQQECLAGNPRVYAQLVAVLGRFSKFASAGEKASVRQSTLSIPSARKDASAPRVPQSPSTPGVRSTPGTPVITSAEDAPL